MNAKDGTLRKEQIYADARHPLKTAKDKNIDESQKDITRFIFSKNDILGKYDTICFTDRSNILELSEDILDMLDKSLLDKSEVAATKE